MEKDSVEQCWRCSSDLLNTLGKELERTILCLQKLGGYSGRFEGGISKATLR
jgi:hypothetical protein